MKLSQQLQKKADHLVSMSPELIALGMLKKAGVDETTARIEMAQEQMEKTAYSKLVDAGIDYDTALSLVKAAGVKVSDLPGFKAEPTEAEKLVDLLTKAASSVAKLEDEVEVLRSGKQGLLQKVASLEEILDEVPETVQAPDNSLIKLAEAGSFNSDELEALSRMPSETLAKIASMQEQPWSMGKSAGVKDGSATDALTQFLLS